VCNFAQNQAGFARLLAESADNHDSLLIDLTGAFRHSDRVSILVTAMSVAGTYEDQLGFASLLADPLEDNPNTLFELRLDAARTRIDVYQPVMGIRTSDPESKHAVELGLGDGWIDYLPLFSQCQDPNLIVIDGQQLIMSGFYVAQTAPQGATSYQLANARSYPTNFDVTVEYLEQASAFRVGYSVVLLPDIPMVPRATDDRLLFFTTAYQDLGSHKDHGLKKRPSQEVDSQVSMIWRWNLTRLANHTIRIYVDPTVPPRWRRWFREGVEGWNDAFALIGRPKAVKAILPGDKDWPEDYDMADARFSTISWVVDTDVLSVGIAKVDPRSGEIIKSDISMGDGWVGAWLSDLDYLAPNLTYQLAAQLLQLQSRHSERRSNWQSELSIDGATSFTLLSASLGKVLNASELEELMGTGLKNTVMHETGHILGLRHNFKGSTAVSYKCTQDKSCTAKQGLGSSVMDYVATNIPLDSNNAAAVDLFSPVVGAYDKLAIRYGYMEANDKLAWPSVAQELEPVLHEAENYPVCYDEDLQYGEDPFCAQYDLGDDPILFYEHQIEEFVQVQRSLLETVQSEESYSSYGHAVRVMLSRTLSVGESLITWLGGIENRHVHNSPGKSRRARRPVSRELQRRALALLVRVLRPRLSGLLPPAEGFPYLVDGTGDGLVYSVDLRAKVKFMTETLVGQALSSARLSQIYKQEFLLGWQQDPAALSVAEFLSEIVSALVPKFQASPAPEEMDLHMQLIINLKHLYFNQSLPAEVGSQVLQQLRRVKDVVDATRVAGYATPHLAMLQRELSEVLCEPGEACLSPRIPARQRSAASSMSALMALTLGTSFFWASFGV